MAGDEPARDEPICLVVRVWLPDRPGALGLVASRIGAIGADIVGVEVLERSDHVAIDEFSVVLSRDDLIRLLVREIEEVDGTSVEQWVRVDRFPDARLDALETVEDILTATGADELATRLVGRVHTEFAADWAAVLRGSEVIASSGRDVPDASMLGAIATGTSASPAVAAGHAGPEDLAIAPLPASGGFLLVGRDGRPFRRRERRQLMALARIADRAATARAHSR